MKKNYWGCLISILLIVFGFIIPMMTNGEHFKCNSNGKCSYYYLLYYFKADKTFFDINSNTNISCVQTPNRPGRYHIVITTDGVNTEIPPHYSADRCNIYKTALRKNIYIRQNRFKEKTNVKLPIAMIIMALIITVPPLFLSLYFQKPENINKQIINPWFGVILAYILVLIGIYISMLIQTKNLYILYNSITEISLLFSSLFFGVLGYGVLASIQAKGYNFRDNYSENFPNEAGFVNRLIAWSKFADGAVYFTNDEMIVVSPDIKNMDLYTQIFKIDDIKNIKKFNSAISIFVSDKKCITLGPPPDIQANIFINYINEIIEKIKAKK